MKVLSLFFIIAILISINAKAQKDTFPVDTINHLFIEEGKLFENIIAKGIDGNIFWTGREEIKTCAQYNKCKKKFPKFVIPKNIAARLKDCKIKIMEEINHDR